MFLGTLDRYSIAGNPDWVNEDLIVEDNEIRLVLDGATGLADKPYVDEVSDARWFVQTIAHSFREHWHSTKKFESSIAAAISDTRAAFESVHPIANEPDYKLPAACLIAIALQDGKFQAYRIGDCSIVDTANPTCKLFRTPELEYLDKQAIDQFSTFLESGFSVTEARERLMPKLRHNRSLINKPNGYAALSLDPDSWQGMDCLDLTPYVEHKGKGSFVLMSDGFSAAFDTFDLPIYRQLAETMAPRLEQILSELRMQESRDSDLLGYPRLKVHDDATALHVQIGLA